MSLNTCISNFMICVNKLTNINCKERSILEPLIILISPFAPHIAEELWAILGNSDSITFEKYPIHDDAFLIETDKEYPISFNGKMKFTLKLSLELSNEEIKRIIIKSMPYTSTQQRNICCGYFCGATACVGVYFFLVLTMFEGQNNTYLTEET